MVVPPEGIDRPVNCSPGPRSLPTTVGGNPARSIRELRGFASRPRGRFAFDTLVLAPPVSAPAAGFLTPRHLLDNGTTSARCWAALPDPRRRPDGLAALAASVAPRSPRRRGSARAHPDARTGGHATSSRSRSELNRSRQPRDVNEGDLVELTRSRPRARQRQLVDGWPIEPDSPARFELLAGAPGGTRSSWSTPTARSAR